MSNPKVIMIDLLSTRLDKLRAEGKSIGLSHGVFDLVHPGHIQHFIAAKKLVDVLVVSITSDSFVNKGPGRPVFSQEVRLETLAALEAVDFVTLSDAPTSEGLIHRIQPDVYFKGSDYKNPADDPTGKINAERATLESYGGRIHFTDEITSSSSKLLNQFYNSFPPDTQSWLKLFKEKYGYETTCSYLDKIQELDVVITGEIIVDQYTSVNALAKSSKDPLLAFQRGRTETFAGGVLAIANNCASWVKSIKVISFKGTEDLFTNNLSLFLNPKIQLKLVDIESRPTVLKHRFVDTNSKVRVFEYYDFVEEIISDSELTSILKQYKDVSKGDIILVADYGHGLVTPDYIEFLTGRENFLAVNTQANAGNRGYNTISKYVRADFFTLNSGELHLELRTKNPDYFRVVPEIMEKLGAENALITLGAEGLIAFDSNLPSQVPALASKIVDKVGAGDSVFAIGSLLARVGAPAQVIGIICNIVAAHEISQLGHRSSLGIGDIKKQLKSLLG